MKHIAIIGSGFGGLSLAVRLQAAGHRVRIFEKREKIGGRAYQLTDAGYTFDMGPSLVTAPSIIRSIFESANRKMEDYIDLVPLDPFYRIFFHDGSHMDYSGDSQRMKEQLARFSEKDAAAYDDFMRDMKGIYDAVITDGLGKQPLIPSAKWRVLCHAPSGSTPSSPWLTWRSHTSRTSGVISCFPSIRYSLADIHFGLPRSMP